MLARSSRAGACSRRATAAAAAMAGALLPESLLPERRGERSDCPEERLACTEGKRRSYSADSEMVSGCGMFGTQQPFHSASWTPAHSLAAATAAC